MALHKLIVKNGEVKASPSFKDGLHTVKTLSKADIRSIEQNKYYWRVVIPTCRYWLDMGHCHSSDDVHHQLKIDYCMSDRPDLITVRKIRTKKGIEERAHPFSWRFSEMPKKEATDYLGWIAKQLSGITGQLDIDYAYRKMEESC